MTELPPAARHECRSYTYSDVWNAIDSLCQRTSGRDWSEVATKLGQYGRWEFED